MAVSKKLLMAVGLVFTIQCSAQQYQYDRSPLVKALFIKFAETLRYHRDLEVRKFDSTLRRLQNLIEAWNYLKSTPHNDLIQLSQETYPKDKITIINDLVIDFVKYCLTGAGAIAVMAFYLSQ